jgi:hypothetical protein
VAALPRGTCPVCFREVALRKGDLVREHVGGCIPLAPDPAEPDDLGGFICGTSYAGSGQKSVESAAMHRAAITQARSAPTLAEVTLEEAIPPCPACQSLLDATTLTERPA